MNMFFVYADGRIATPELNGSILEGVTRASVLDLAADLGHPVEERRISADEWKDGVRAADCESGGRSAALLAGDLRGAEGVPA